MLIDHLVYGVPDLHEGVKRLERLLGLSAVAGGRHTGRGTRNALLGLGGGSYLEIIAPDPAQKEEDLVMPRPFDVHVGMAPRFVGWALRDENIEDTVRSARTRGYDPGDVQPRQRLAPDGTAVTWRLSGHRVTQANFMVPFLIAWGTTQHPSEQAPRGARLLKLTAEHPDPAVLAVPYDALGIDLPVSTGTDPRLKATLDTPNGQVHLQ